MRLKLNIFYTIITFFLFTTIGLAQNPEKRLKDPTPDVDPIGSLEDFIAMFKVWDLGNLHVYAKPQDVLEFDYFFKGQPVNKASRKYLPLETRRTTRGTNDQVYAIGEISGVSRNKLYIIRVNDADQANRLLFTRLEDGKLKIIDTLAYFKKTENGYEQLDTWLQDINGDMLPDMIRKTRILNVQGQEQIAETEVWLQLKDGTFHISHDVAIQPADYQFEEIL